MSTKTIELKKDKIYLKLRQSIINGKLPAGKKLPNETDFARNLKVGRITLRASLDRLEYEGYIKRIHGKGTFVSPENVKPEKIPTILVISGASTSSFENPQNYIVPEIIRFAESKELETLVTSDSTLLMFSSDDIKNYVKKNNVIGIIAVMNHFHGNEPILSKLRCSGVPVVMPHCLKNDPENTGFAGISIDERDGWKTAIEYLAERGYKNIGLIGLAGRHMFRNFSKQECLELLENNGIEPIESLLVQVNFDRELIKNTVRNMFAGEKTPTAILCYSDFCAIYVYEALKEMKLKIPKNVAVMGTCGYPDAVLLSPPAVYCRLRVRRIRGNGSGNAATAGKMVFKWKR